MDNVQLNRLKELLQKNDRVAIAVGKNPTVDDMAAALGLYLALSTGKKVSIASSTEPLVEHSSLVGIDKVRSRFEGESGDLVVSFPYREGEIEKVSYTIDQGLLNIVVKAGQQGLTFSEQDVKFSRSGGTPSLLFIIGTPRLSDLGNLFNPEELKDTTIVNIDNKQDNQGFGDIVLVSPKASSVSEEMASILISLGLEMDMDTAQNLMLGIDFATENFQSPLTSYLAFQMAGELMRRGAMRKPAQAPVTRPQQVARPSQMPQMPRPQAPIQNAMPQSQNEERPQSASSFMPEQAATRPNQNRDRKPPSDWLTPKVYKGSSNF